jgi:hypothetical protein
MHGTACFVLFPCGCFITHSGVGTGHRVGDAVAHRGDCRCTTRTAFVAQVVHQVVHVLAVHTCRQATFAVWGTGCPWSTLPAKCARRRRNEAVATRSAMAYQYALAFSDFPGKSSSEPFAAYSNTE